MFRWRAVKRKVMLGWKAAERKVAGPTLIDPAVARVTRLGFVEHVRQPGHVVLRRAGSHFLLIRGSSAPLELTIVETEDGLFLRLRYHTLVAFDTGDLERLADEVVDTMTGATT